MDTKEVIAEFRADLQKLQNEGRETVNVAGALAYLDALEANSESSVEYKKMHHASQLAGFAAQKEQDKAMFDSVMTTSHNALKAAMFANGGAAVAMLGAASNVLSKKDALMPASQVMTEAFVRGAACFAAGVLLAAIASGTTYLAQFCYHQRWDKTGTSSHISSVVLVVSSYVCFASGIALGLPVMK